MRRSLAWTGLLAVVVLAVAGLWSAASPRQATPDRTAESVAAGLRCPTCVAESVADSTAPLAEGMRAVIDEQLAEGRSPDEIRAWFVDRYGEQVLLEPPRRGAGLALWLLPLVVAPVAAWFVVRGRHGRRTTAAWLASATAVLVVAAAWLASERDRPGDDPAVHGAAAESAASHPVRVLQHAVQEEPADIAMRTALARALERTDRFTEAAEQYAAAVRLAPGDDTVLYRAAFALVRADRPADAVPLLEQLLARSADHAEGLLLLGTLRHQGGDASADELLTRFIEVAPDHPAAERAKEMVNGGDRR